MKKHVSTAGIIVATALAAGAAHARDSGPRFPQDRLDALVAAHRLAARSIRAPGAPVTGRSQGTQPPR